MSPGRGLRGPQALPLAGRPADRGTDGPALPAESRTDPWARSRKATGVDYPVTPDRRRLGAPGSGSVCVDGRMQINRFWRPRLRMNPCSLSGGNRSRSLPSPPTPSPGPAAVAGEARIAGHREWPAAAVAQEPSPGLATRSSPQRAQGWPACWHRAQTAGMLAKSIAAHAEVAQSGGAVPDSASR